MSRKDKKLLNLLLELNSRLINISRKVDNLSIPEENYIELEVEPSILIPEDVYLEICDEIGEDMMQFMGIS